MGRFCLLLVSLLTGCADVPANLFPSKCVYEIVISTPGPEADLKERLKAKEQLRNAEALKLCVKGLS